MTTPSQLLLPGIIPICGGQQIIDPFGVDPFGGDTGGSRFTTTGTSRGTTTVSPRVSGEQQLAIEQLLPLLLGTAGAQAQLGMQGAEMMSIGAPGSLEDLLNALQLSPAESALGGIQSGVNVPLAGAFGREAAGLAGPTPTSILEPLEQEFTNTVMPGISSAAIRAGAPGGSAEQDLTKQAVGSFGRAATGVLASTAADRFRALTPVPNILSQLLLQGPTTEAQMGERGRGLATSRAMAPLNIGQMLISAARGMPITQVPFAPPGMETTTEGETTGAGTQTNFMTSFGTIMSILPLIMAFAGSSARLKKDIEPLDKDEYTDALVKILETPIVRYNYKWEPKGRKKHIGPILEMAPDEIKRDALTVSLLDYNGLTHAAVKGLAKKVNLLEEQLEELSYA